MNRTLLFVILTAAFGVSTPVVVLYSQGYRINFETLSVVQTGGLFVEASPNSVSLFLDGKKRSSTSPFFGTKFIQNLLPGQHTLVVKKEGFTEWRKTIEIKEKQTSEIRNVLLLPLVPQSKEILQNAELLFAQEEAEVFIALARNKEGDATFFVSSLHENSQTTSYYTFQGETASFLKKEIRVKDVSPEGRAIIETADPSEKERVYVINFENLGVTEIKSSTQIRDAMFYPANPQYVIFRAGESLSVFNTATQQSRLVLSAIRAFGISGHAIYYIQTKGDTIVSSPLETLLAPSSARETIVQKTFYPLPKSLPSEGSLEIKVFSNGDLFLFADGAVFMWQREKKEWILVLSNIQGARATLNQKAIAAWNTNTIWYLGPKKDDTLNARNARMAARYHSPISNVFWFGKNYAYILFGVGDQIEIKELSFDNQENTVRLPFRITSFFFHQKTGALYYIQDGTLYKSMLYAS